MKNRMSLFLIVVFTITGLYAAFAVRDNGRKCFGTFPTTLLSSANKHIIEKYEWTDTHTLNPRIVRVGYEDATISGMIWAQQKTTGNGTIGVFPEGAVSGPDFSLELEKKFEIRGVGMIIGVPDVTFMHTKNSDTNDDPGPYTLTGSADFVAVGGGGGIKVDNLGGVTFSGPVQFNTTKTASTVTHTLTVKEKRPGSHECVHENCSVQLPSRFFHRQPCQEKRWRSASKTEITCNRLYYRCQESTCPLDYLHVATHACGNHKDTKQGVRLNKSSHELQASCPISITQDGTNVYCRVSNFYACEDPAHTCDFPPPNNNGNNGNNGGNTAPSQSTPSTPAPAPTPITYACGVHSGDPSNSSEHVQVTGDCGHTYYKCQAISGQHYRPRCTSRKRGKRCTVRWWRCQYPNGKRHKHTYGRR